MIIWLNNIDGCLLLFGIKLPCELISIPKTIYKDILKDIDMIFMNTYRNPNIKSLKSICSSYFDSQSPERDARRG